jgi:type IV pilus assembly protein PilY1
VFLLFFLSLAAAFSEWAQSIDVAQQPLVAEKAIDPNVVLLYEQTGSMGNNWAPHFPGEDYYYSGAHQDRALRAQGYQNAGTLEVNEGDRLLIGSPLINDLYYNPERTYQPPFYYDSGKLKRYPNSDTLSVFPTMKINGFPVRAGDNNPDHVGKIRLDVNRNAPPPGVHYWEYANAEGGWKEGGMAVSCRGAHCGVDMAGYVDYVPGFASMRDNPNYDPTLNPEDSRNNYEYWAFRTVEAGSWFRTSRTVPAFKSRAAAQNQTLVRQRACPTVFKTVEESRQYYEGKKAGPLTGRPLMTPPPLMAADDEGKKRGVPHGQCRNTYRVWGPASMGNVKGYTSTSYFRRNFNGQDDPADARPLNLPNGRPWCMRRTYADLTGPKSGTSLGYIVTDGNSNPESGANSYYATYTRLQSGAATHHQNSVGSKFSPMEYTPFTDTWSNGASASWETPSTNRVRMPLNCFAGRHVIGDVNGDGVYDHLDKARENEPVSYFAYKGKLWGAVMPTGSDVNALRTCLPSGARNACGNLNGPEQSLLHLAASHVGDDGELVMDNPPRRRTGKEEIRNYMNWFTYYRSRALAAKSAMSLSFAALLDRNDTTKASGLMKGQFIRLGYGLTSDPALELDSPTDNHGPGQQGSRSGSGVVPFRDFPADAKHPDDILPDGTPKPGARPHPYAGQKFVRQFYDFIATDATSWGAYDNTRGRRLHRSLNTVGKYYTTLAPWRTYPPVGHVAGGVGGRDGDDGKVYGCRRSFAILVGDGDSDEQYACLNNAGPNPARPGTFANCDVTQTTGPVIWRTDTDNLPMNGSGGRADLGSYQYFPQPPFTSLTNDPRHPVFGSIADIALYYWMRDLRPDVPNLLSPTDKNPAFWQHMQTFTMTVGADGSLTDTEVNNLLAKSSRGGATSSIYWTYPGWLDSYYERVDDVMRAGLAGHGGTASATNSDDFARKLTAALTEVSGTPTKSGGMPAIGSGDRKAETLTLRSRYVPGSWTSVLEAVPQKNGKLAAKALWEAGRTLTVQFATPLRVSLRKVFTWDQSAGKGVAFDSSLSASIKGVLDAPVDRAAGGGSSATVRDVCPFAHSAANCAFGDGTPYDVNLLIAWLRGDRSKEDTAGAYAAYPNGFRRREILLGDSIDKTPYLLGNYEFNDYGYGGFDCGQGVKAARGRASCPTNAFFSATAIDDYVRRAASLHAKRVSGNKNGTAFFPANDGMLHAIDLANGMELFAYVPAGVHGNLKALADPEYRANHRYYVDGEPLVKDVLFGSQWRSVLVGHTGRGGRSFFALDVEDAKNFSAGDVLWEFTDPDLGAPVDGEGVITPVAGFQGDNGKWAVLFGNGYNSDHGDACLFVVSLGKSASPKAEKICVPAQGQGAQNGLGVPVAVDTDGDGAVDVAYAGDLLGNLWKFNLRTMRVTEKLLRATDKRGRPQPIVAPPLPVPVKESGGGYNVLQLIAGTGKYIEKKDVTSTQAQSLYGVRDMRPLSTNGTATRANLLERAYDPGRQDRGDLFQRTGAPPEYHAHTWKLRVNTPAASETPKYGAGQMGWVIDLDGKNMRNWLIRAQGTRVKNPWHLAQPTILPGEDPCASTLTGGVMEINLETGGWIKSALYSSIKNQANIWIDDETYGEEINRDGKFGKSELQIPVPDPNKPGGTLMARLNDTADSRVVILGKAPPNPCQNGPLLAAGKNNPYQANPCAGGRPSGRQSWRQLR